MTVMRTVTAGFLHTVFIFCVLKPFLLIHNSGIISPSKKDAQDPGAATVYTMRNCAEK